MEHKDLEFEPVIADAIVQMLKDTGKSFIDEQPDETSQFDHIADSDRKVSISCAHENDLISREAAIEAIAKQMPKSYTSDGSHPGDEEIYKIQEIYVDCIESIEILPAVQPDHNAEIGKKVSISCGQDNDLISRQAARHALCKAVHKGEDIPCENQTASCLWTGTRVCDYVREIDALPTVQPDHVAEIGKKAEGDCISRQEALKICRRYWHPTFNPIMEEIEKLPSVQPEQRWVPVTERLPENDNEVLITVWDAEDDYVEVYKGFYQGHEWWTQWCHGCSKIKDEPCGENIVIAWMPLPVPYKGGDSE